MNNYFKLGLGLAAVMAIAFLATGGFTGFTSAKGFEKVRAAEISQTQSAPLYYAIENKLFEKEGLELETVRFQAPKDIIDAVSLGRIDFTAPSAATGISAIAESIEPGKIKYYAFACEPDGGSMQLLVRNESNITSFSGLQGKKVGHLPGPQWKTITSRIISLNNVSLDSVQLLDLAIPLQLQALESGQVDAVMAYNPIPQIAIEKGTGKIAVSNVGEKFIANPFCPGAGLFSSKFLAERPEAAKKVLKVMKESVEELKKKPHPELAVKYLKVGSKVAEMLPHPIHSFIFFNELTLQEKSGIQKFLDLFYEEKVMGKRVLLGEMLLNSTGLP